MRNALLRRRPRGRSALVVVAGLAAVILTVVVLVAVLQRGSQPVATVSPDSSTAETEAAEPQTSASTQAREGQQSPEDADREAVESNPAAPPAPAEAPEAPVAPELVWEGEVISEETGNPVEGARVMAFLDLLGASRTGSYEVPSPEAETVSGADGRFAVPLPPETTESDVILLIAHADGYAGKATYAIAQQDDFRNLEFRTIALPGAAGMRGRVVDETGAGVSGALIGGIMLQNNRQRYAGGERPLGDSAWTFSESDGSFSLAGTSPGAAYFISARARGYAHGVSEEAEADAQDVEIVLDSQPAIVRGTVRDDAGVPVADASIRVMPVRDMTTWGPRQQRRMMLMGADTTDSSGQFEISGLVEGDWTIAAHREFQSGTIPGDSVREEFALQRGEERTIDLEFAPRVILTGRALNNQNDQPVSGILVSLLPFETWTQDGQQRNEEAFASAIRTDAGGRFRIEVPGGSQWLHYHVPDGWVDTSTMHAGRLHMPETAAKQERDLEIRVVPGEVLEGIVYQQDGETPAKGGTVSARPRVMTGMVRPNQTNVGSDGRFSLSVEPGQDLLIQVWSEIGWATEELTGEWPDEVVLVLEGYATVKGQVRDSEGEGIPGMFITARPTSQEAAMFSYHSTQSDADGFYEHTTVYPGTGEMQVSHMGRDMGRVPPPPVAFEVEAGEVLEGVDIVFDEGDFVEGVVMDEDGELIEGARVSFHTQAASFSSGNTHTDEEGYFRIAGLPEGGVLSSVSVSADGYVGDSRQNVSPMAGAMTFTLKKTQGRSLVVRDERSRPVTHYEYALFSNAWDTRFVDGVPLRKVRSEDGQTTLEGLTPGGRRVAVVELDEEGEPTGRSGAKLFSVSDDKDDAPPVEVVLSSGTTIRGKVVEAETETPVSGAIVKQLTYQRPGWNRPGRTQLPDRFRLEQAVTDSSGEFVITGVQPGTWYLTANAEGMSAGTEGVEVVVEEGQQPPDVTIPVSRLGSIYGTVTGADGEPAENAQVRWYPRNMWADNNRTTDGNGQYKLEELFPGTWSVTVSDSEGRTQYNNEIEVQGDDVEVNFDLRGMVKITVSVMIDGQSWTQRPDAGVSLRPVAEGAMGTTRLSNQGATFDTWQPPGEIRAHLTQGHQDRGYVGTYTIDPTPAEQDLAINIATASIDYAIEPPEGAEMPEGYVQFTSTGPNGEEQSMPVWNPEPRGHLPLVAAGRYKASFNSRDNLYEGETEWQDVPPGGSAVFVIFLEEQDTEESLLAQVQRMLNELGFDAGPVDGIMGPMTAGALRAFQSANELEVTGTATEATVNALKAQTGG